MLNKDALSSFENFKRELSSISALAHPVPEAPLSLTVDASDSAVGSVLQQVVKGITQSVAFFSCQIKSAERQYSTFDRELLAIYLSVRHFRHYLERRDFAVYTDHKALTFADRHSTSTFRHLDYISQFTSDIRHIPGTENVRAGALSRLPVASISTPTSINLTAVAKDQPALDSLDLTSDEYSGCKFSLVPLPVLEGTIPYDTAIGVPRPLVPEQHRRSVFDTLHLPSHPGVAASVKLITTLFFWPNMQRIKTTWVSACLHCNVKRFNVRFEFPLVFSLNQKSGYDICI